MVVTDDGIITDFNPDPKNAQSSILKMSLPIIVMLVNAVHLKNEYARMRVKPDGIVTEPLDTSLQFNSDALGYHSEPDSNRTPLVGKLVQPIKLLLPRVITEAGIVIVLIGVLQNVFHSILETLLTDSNVIEAKLLQPLKA